MSRQGLTVVSVGSFPKKIGFLGSLISIKAVPSSRPESTYSFPDSISTQPQLSFAASLPKVSKEIFASKS